MAFDRSEQAMASLALNLVVEHFFGKIGSIVPFERSIALVLILSVSIYDILRDLFIA